MIDEKNTAFSHDHQNHHRHKELCRDYKCSLKNILSANIILISFLYLVFVNHFSISCDMPARKPAKKPGLIQRMVDSRLRDIFKIY